MKVNQLLESIKENYKKEFPNSIIKAEFNNSLGSYKSIYVKCYLAGNKDEFMHGIPQNDMFNITFFGHSLPKELEIDSELPENFSLECSDKSYLIKPDSQYLCYSRRKLSYRKTAGAEKNIKSLDKFFKKLKEELQKDLENNNIHDNHIELLKEKLS